MVTYLHIRAINQLSTVGRLTVAGVTFPCLLGRSGRTHAKREADGTSPIGVWDLRNGFYRSDRIRHPQCRLLVRPLRKTDGWCDDASSGLYNKLVRVPLDSSHERMWRDDEAYDVVFPTSHNERPCTRHRGSAIFFHLTRPDSQMTAGCIAVSGRNMGKILALCETKVSLVIWPCQGGPPVGLQKSHYRS